MTHYYKNIIMKSSKLQRMHSLKSIPDTTQSHINNSVTKRTLLTVSSIDEVYIFSFQGYGSQGYALRIEGLKKVFMCT